MPSRLALLLVITFSLLTGLQNTDAQFDSSTSNREKEELKILRITPSGTDIPAGNQIVIEFNQPVVPVGNMQRKASELPIRIKPSLACQWRWLNTRSLACELSNKNKLNKSTKYLVTVRPGIRTPSGKTLSKPVLHSFITRRPQLNHPSIQNWRSPFTPIIYVSFDQKVKKPSLEKHLYFKTPNGGRIPALVVNRSTYSQLEIRIDHGNVISQIDRKQNYPSNRYWYLLPARPLPKASQIELMVEPGIQSEEGPLAGVENKRILQFFTFDDFKLLAVQCEDASFQKIRTELATKVPLASRCTPEYPVELRMSAPVDPNTALSGIKIIPEPEKLDRFWRRSYVDSSLYGSRKEWSVDLRNLKPYSNYSLQLLKDNLRDVFGRKLVENYQTSFQTDHFQPDYRFSNRSSVLETEVNTHLPFTAINLDRLDFKYEILSSDKVIKDLRRSRKIESPQNSFFHIPLFIRDWLDQYINEPWWTRLLHWWEPEEFPKRSGVIKAEFNESPATRNRYDNRFFLVQVTPYNVHAKIGYHNTYIWVTELDSGEPVSGATIDLYVDSEFSFNENPEVLASAETNSDGLAVLKGASTIDPDRNYSPRRKWRGPYLVAKVTKRDKIAYLPFDSEYSAYPVSGSGNYISNYARDQLGLVKVWGTSAQGVYKPGEQVDYKFFVRNQSLKTFAKAPSGPYQLKVYDSRGKKVHEAKNIQLSDFGSYSGSFTISKNASAGWYRFRLSQGAEQWSALSVLVADFSPAAFRVNSELKKDIFGLGQEVDFNSSAELYSGGPLTQSEARVTAYVRGKALKARDPKFSKFQFNAYQNTKNHRLYQERTQLDNNGEVKGSFELKQAPEVYYGSLKLETSVKDDRGKFISHEDSATYYARDRFVGVFNESWNLKESEKARIEFIAIDQNQEVVSGVEVSVVFEAYEAVSVRVKGPGNAYLNKTEYQWKKVDDCNIRTQSEAVYCEFTPESAGRSRVTASIKDTKGNTHETRIHRYVVGSSYVLWENKPGHALEIIPEKTDYAVGETARFLIKNPYPDSTALLSIERFGVLKAWTQRLGNSTQLIEFEVQEDHLPGFYFSGVLVSPRQDKAIEKGVDLGKPVFKQGYVSIQVKDKSKEILVQAKTDKADYKPRETVRLNFKLSTRQGDSPRSELAVAVLDSSVFDLIQSGKSYFDPYEAFYVLEPMDVFNYSLLNQIVGRQKFSEKGANPGGGGLEKAQRAMMGAGLSKSEEGPSLRDFFKYVAYWNPSLPVNSSGEATAEFKLPDNLTEWKVIGIAVDKTDKMGLGISSFKTSLPVELSAAMPNQVLEDDEFTARFSIFNRTEKLRKLDIEVKASGAVAKEKQVKDQKQVKQFERQFIDLDLTASEPGEILLEAKAQDSEVGDFLEHKLPVLKKSSSQVAATYGSSTTNQIVEPFAFPADMLSDAGEVKLQLFSSVVSNLQPAFENIVTYPYQSYESILSTSLMALSYGQLKDYLSGDFEWPDAAKAQAKALKVVKSYQAPNGGICFFTPYDRYASPYLSAYTLLAFRWFESAGLQIPRDVESRLVAYLQDFLREKEFPDLYTRKIFNTVRSVALAALSWKSIANFSDFDRVYEARNEMSLFGKAHLLLASKWIRDDRIPERRKILAEIMRSHANETGGKFVFQEELETGFKQILHSSLRMNCAALYSFLELEDLDFDSDLAFKLVRSITQSRGNTNHWENTQENVFCMQALNNYRRRYENQQPEMKIEAKLGSQSLGKVEFKTKTDGIKSLSRPVQKGDPGQKLKLEITKEGDGRFYYSAQLHYSLKSAKSEPVNAGLTLKKEVYLEQDGKFVQLKSPFKIQRGDIVRVDLFVSLPAPRHFLVVSDHVPGGLEALNSELATTSRVDLQKLKNNFSQGSWWHSQDRWIPYNSSFWSFYHFEVRHSKVNFYSQYLPAGNYYLSYMAQAIAAGKFSVLPTHAEEIYDPDTFAKSSPFRLQVSENR